MCDGTPHQFGHEADHEDGVDASSLSEAGESVSAAADDRGVILIVEDQDELRTVLCDLIATVGLEGVGTPDGLAAWEWLEERNRNGSAPPAMILLDLMMPRMDGWEFRRRQLEDARFVQIPVLLMSGSFDVEADARTLRAAGGFIKPVPFGLLYSAIEGILGRR